GAGCVRATPPRRAQPPLPRSASRAGRANELSVDPRTPCLIGVAQQTWRDADLAPEPLDMWEEVSAAAAVDAGLTDLAALDSVQVVYTQSWQYDDPAGRLCERLHATPGHRFYSGIGGTTPQLLVNKTCESLLAGEYDLALI